MPASDIAEAACGVTPPRSGDRDRPGAPSQIDRPRTYAAPGVAEVWRFDDQRLLIERLGEDGPYRAATSSGFFAGRGAEIVRWPVHEDLVGYSETISSGLMPIRSCQLATSSTVIRWPSMRGLPPQVPGVLTIRTRSSGGSLLRSVTSARS
jgi:hypothetical protein